MFLWWGNILTLKILYFVFCTSSKSTSERLQVSSSSVLIPFMSLNNLRSLLKKKNNNNKLFNTVSFYWLHSSIKTQDAGADLFLYNFSWSQLSQVLEYWTLLFLHIQVHILPCRQNDLTLQEHSTTYFLPDICKVTWQLLSWGGGGVLKGLVRFIYCTATYSGSLSPLSLCHFLLFLHHQGS